MGDATASGTQGDTVRARTVLSTIVGVLFFFPLAPIAAIPAYVELDFASRHNHPVTHPLWVLEGVLAAVFFVWSGILFVRKSTKASAMLFPGILGVVIGMLGIFEHAGNVLTRASISTGREAAMYLGAMLLPGLTGVGQILEARRGPARIAYFGYFGVLALFAAIAFGACKR